MGGPGPGRQAPIAGPVGRMGCIWLATPSPLCTPVRVYPPRRARAVGAGAASPRFTGCAAGPVCPAPQWRARPHHISLAGHTVRSPTSRAVAHRYHVDAVHADHAAYPTVPPSPPPQCTCARGGCEARGMIGGANSKAAAPAFIGRACLCRRHLTQPSLISDGLSPSSSRCRPASLRSSPRRATCTPAASNRLSWPSRCSLAPWCRGPTPSSFQIGTTWTWRRTARTGGYRKQAAVTQAAMDTATAPAIIVMDATYGSLVGNPATIIVRPKDSPQDGADSRLS